MRKRVFWKRITAILLAISVAVPMGVLYPSLVASASGENLVENGSFDGDDVYNSAGWENVGEAEQVAQTKEYELVENGDFEEGNSNSGSNGWETKTPARSTLSVIDDSGNKALQVIASEANAQANFCVAETGFLEIGKTYTVSFDIKRTSGTDGLTLYTVGVIDSWETHGWKALSGDWKTVTAQFTPQLEQAGAQIGFQLESACTVLVDNFSISYTGVDSVTTVTEVVLNGDFSAGNSGSGNNGWYANSAAALQVVNESGAEDNKVLEITSTGVGVAFFEVSTPTYEIGKTYTVSYRMRSTGGNIGFTNYTELIASGWKSHGWKNANTTWQTVSYDITAVQNRAWAQVGIQFDGTTGDNKLYIDDFSITTSETKTNYEYKDGLVVEDGDYALLMSTMTSVMNTVTGTKLSEGQTYDYSFYVKNKETASDFSLKFCADSIKKKALTGAYEASDTWSFITGSFTVPEGGVTKIGFERSGMGEVYIDDLTITEHALTENDVVLRFAVVSDMHIDLTQTGNQRANKFANVISSAYDYSENQPYEKLDALVVVGDMVNSGVKAEYDLYNQKLNEEIKAGTEVIEIMGNHEYWGNIDTADIYKEEVSQEFNQHIEINGYHFLGISQDNDDSYTSSMDWLETELAVAAEGSVGKPMFAFQHIGIQNTAYGTYEGGYTKSSEEMDALYRQHSNLIHFSGHTHTPINTPTIISQSDYTQVATGTLYYICMENDATYGTQPPNSNDVSQYYIVEVYADNRVEIKPYNQLTNSFFKTPSTTDAEDTEIVYTVDVNDKENWLYTASRTEGNKAPYFEPGDAITFDKVTYKSAQITFQQAEDDNGVYRYEITCIPESGEGKNYSIFSEYYFEPMADTLSYGVAGLEEDTEYVVTVTPVDFYGVKGEALTSTLRTVTKSENKFTLSLRQYYVDRHIDLSVSNGDLLTGSYYKIPVTLDGVDGYTAASNSGSYMTIWPEFINVYGKMTMNTSILIEEGAVLKEVESSRWTEIEGGDSVVLDKTLYLEFENGVFVDKTAEYLLNILLEEVDEFEGVSVTSTHVTVLDNLLVRAQSLQKDNTLSAEQLKTVETVIAKVNALLTKIADAKAAIETSNIVDATAITKDNVTLDDQTILETAKNELQNALATYGEHYTTEEKSAVQELLINIQTALTTISNVKKVIADVAALPEVDEANIKDANIRKTILSAEQAFNALRDYEKKLVDEITITKVTSLAEIVHQYEKEHKEIIMPGKAATCTTTGLTEGKKCSCGEVLVEQKVISKLAHKEVVVKGKAATTTATGLTDGKKCSVCGTVTVQQKTIAKIKKPGASKITKATGGKKKITIKFKKVKSIKGYEIQIATKSNMKKGVKTFTVKASKTSYIAKNLKSKTKYWVRIRTYKMVNGKKITSSWSKKVTVKTK